MMPHSVLNPFDKSTQVNPSESLAQPLDQTLAQKLIAQAAKIQFASVGEIVICDVDLAMFHDSSGPRRLKPMLESLGAHIWNKDRVVLVMDHFVPEADDDARKIVRIAREWAHEQQLPNVYDSQGICHVVVPQHGHILPGMLCVGGDSHSPTGGAFGAYMFGIGSTEMLGVMVTGQIWLKVPETIRMHWQGALASGVCAKDMMLAMIGRFGMNGGRYQAIEYTGSTIAGLGMAERMTLSNMSAELGSQVGLIAPDTTTLNWLQDRLKQRAAKNLKDTLVQASIEQLAQVDLAHWQTDAQALYTQHTFDATTLAPMVAAPHSPANSQAVTEYGRTPIDIAYIGACTGAKLEDLVAAASILKGHHVPRHVKLMVAPASVSDMQKAKDLGVADILQNAGAEFLPSTCGACAGYGHTIPGDARVISTTARNFKGRMGSPDSQVYLASPFTVAASALTGFISDPREVMA
jgi:3-isopropylmalate/(R)-2-methylmalate dehydratase large subunit